MLNFKRITSGIEIETSPVTQEGQTIPHRIAVLGYAGDTYKDTPKNGIEVVDSYEASSIFGAGSMLARMVRNLDGVAGKIVCYPLTKPSGAVAKSVKVAKKNGGDTFTENGQLEIVLNDEKFVEPFSKEQTLKDFFANIEKVFSMNPDLAVTAKANEGTDITFTANWVGKISDDIKISIEGDKDSFTITETSGTGAIPANIKEIYESFGDTWHTIGVHPFTDKDTIEKIGRLSEKRSDPVLHQPILNIFGFTGGYAEAKKLVEPLDDPSLMVVCVPSSPTLPGEIAADEAYKRIQCSQEQPNISGRNIALRNTKPPLDTWSPAQKEAIVLAGGATVATHGGNVFVDNETTTSKTVNGRENSIWRWSSTVICNMAKIHSLNEMASREPFDDYLMINEDSQCTSPKALKPSTIKQYLANLMTQWVRDGWSKNLEDMLESIKISIPKGNPQAYYLEFCDDNALSGKRLFVRYCAMATAKV